MTKTFNGTNPAVDQSVTTYAPPAGTGHAFPVTSNIDFAGLQRGTYGVDELLVQLDALIDLSVAGTFTVENKADFTNLMRVLGTVLQNTTVESFRGKDSGATPASGSIAEKLGVICNL